MDAERPVLPFERPSPALRLAMVVVGVTLFALYAVLAGALYLLLDGFVRGLTRVDVAFTLGLVVVFTLAFGVSSYRFATERLLAGLDARELSPEEAPELRRRVRSLAAELDIDPPAVAVARMTMPNALAVGGGRGTVVLDRRLLGLLGGPELEAIVAHELSHLESRDGLVQTLAYSLVRTLVGLVVLVLAPVALLLRGFSRALAWVRGEPRRSAGVGERLYGLAARAVIGTLFVLTLAVRAHSRRREFRADERAAELTGRPVALARALRKIERASRPASGLLATLYVHAEEDEDPVTRLLATHPPMDERVARLVAMAEAREQEATSEAVRIQVR
jgi:heat shock protein HtpX